MILDAVVLAILALCIYLGYRRGLIRTLFKLCSFLASIFLAWMLYPIVANWLRTTPVYDGIKNFLLTNMSLEEAGAQTGAQLIEGFPLPGVLQEVLLAHYQSAMQETIASVEIFVARFFADLATNMLAIVLVFIAVWVLLRILSGMLDIVSKLPVINTFNRIGGIAAGLLKGALVCWAGMTVVVFFFLSPTMQAQLNASWVGIWFYENNPILAMLAHWF